MCNITSRGHRNYPLDKANQCDHPLFPCDLKAKLFFFILFLKPLRGNIKWYFVDSVLDILVICSHCHPCVNDVDGFQKRTWCWQNKRFAYHDKVQPYLHRNKPHLLSTSSTSDYRLIWQFGIPAQLTPSDCLYYIWAVHTRLPLNLRRKPNSAEIVSTCVALKYFHPTLMDSV